ncbi:nuclear transport factor 2 family protein [Zavarzinia compransoris]|uniref:Nuclear transport factor 2 family protein n=1 Tax=Zavarzinia compransoris TaxID=1264899 RepID=A0A317E0R7_9PROT|nr:nuclear transport factor 2 family protein [Zavarzinia compransoris]PWR20559.1 nuclear transport factor 2 family protein [Zavarzinia compransoris]TDP43795.1 ketosteroid isomerase-like protein [Zavarzinia compransoris]
MYHAIVKRRVRALFAAVSQGDAEPVLRQFAPRFEHRCLGDSALGGVRRSLAATRAWYRRLYRLMPDIGFTLEDIAVAGGPWHTIVTATWEERNSGTDGVETRNRGIHVLTLRWGRATALLICPDTAGLTATLDRLAAAGVAEAKAAPILD